MKRSPATKESRKAASNRWARANFKMKYGMSNDQFYAMSASQGNKCKICGCEVKLTVDHDHVTGKVRGLLCGHCNSILGMSDDNQETLSRAIEYLKLHGADQCS